MFMQQLKWLLGVWLFFGCAKVIAVGEIPPVTLGEPAFFPTIEAHTDAPIMAGNRVDVLLNGDETFPVMLRDIKSAQQSITFAQYLLRRRCSRPAVCRSLRRAMPRRHKGGILLDDHGSGQIPPMKSSP